MAFSHANCDHPSTPAARKKCRDNQKKIADGKIKDTKNVRELQNALTEAFREQILGVGGITVAEIRDMLDDMPTDAVDQWFSGKLPAMMKVVEAQHKEAMLLTTKYLKEHAALLGYSAGKLDKIGMVWEQVTTSLEVTGPVAFKTHIAAGGTAEAAKKVMATTLSGSAERLALQGSHDTLTEAVANPDSNVLGYTRNTSSTACDYCASLSTAAVYHANTFHAHDHCTCTGEPLYLDPRFFPQASQVDWDKNWEGAVKAEPDLEGFSAAMADDDDDFFAYSLEDLLEDENMLFEALNMGAARVWEELTHDGLIDHWLMKKKMDQFLGPDNMDKWTEWAEYQAALKAYTGIPYENMNRFLRGLPRAEFRDLDKPDEFYHNMNSYLLRYFEKEAAVLPYDLQLYRGIKDGKAVFGEYFDLDDMSGMVFDDKAFTSTTISPSIATQFAENSFGQANTGQRVMLRIVGKKGTKAVLGNQEEGEIIFPPGTKFRVVRDYTKNPVDELGLTNADGSPITGQGQRWLDLEIVE